MQGHNPTPRQGAARPPPGRRVQGRRHTGSARPPPASKLPWLLVGILVLTSAALSAALVANSSSGPDTKNTARDNRGGSEDQTAAQSSKERIAQFEERARQLEKNLAEARRERLELQGELDKATRRAEQAESEFLKLNRDANTAKNRLADAQRKIKSLQKELQPKVTVKAPPGPSEGMCAFCDGQGWYWEVLNGPNGDKKAICGACGGDGRGGPYARRGGRPPGTACEGCFGAGQIIENGKKKNCSYCGGTGRSRNRKRP